jgi:hypothetical protein
MSKATKSIETEPEAKRGPALWKQQLGEISDRNADARKRGQARVKVLASTRAGNRRVTAGHEADQLRKLNAKLDKARTHR